MLFNSLEFILFFLPVVVGIFYALVKKVGLKAGNTWLLLSSAFFYGYWQPEYLLLLLFSIVINYAIARQFLLIPVPRKNWLRLGIAINLGLLAYFKYSYFILQNLNWIGIYDGSMPSIVLPLAISFFTFQQIAYLVDSYQGKVKIQGLLSYSLFVSFFPQLIAGPIVHHKEMMPQFSQKKRLNFLHLQQGIFIFSLGLAKKVLIADALSPLVKFFFDGSEMMNILNSSIASLTYSMQLYFDFSGYTDMAWGAALMLGIKLPQNFNSPYQAKSVGDFWRRWHITLSRFLRDYVYIPLGGNRIKFLRTLANLILTFIIGGIWHGAAWTFVFWGLLHGFALVAERLAAKYGVKLNNFLAWIFTFLFVNLAWIFFRAPSWNRAMDFLSGFTNFDEMKWESIWSSYEKAIIILPLAMLFAFNGKNSNELLKKSLGKRSLIAAFVLFILSILHLNQLSEFIYFQF